MFYIQLLNINDICIPLCWLCSVYPNAALPALIHEAAWMGKEFLRRTEPFRQSGLPGFHNKTCSIATQN